MERTQEWEWIFVVGETQDESQEVDELGSVDQIIASRRRLKRMEYKVHYENTDANEWVWESLENLIDNMDKVREFEIGQKWAKDCN
jgi:hypothetical protein